jgi:hypothetical protein
MKADNDVRKHWIHLRLTRAEYDKIQTAFKKTTCRKLSEYIRDILLNEPITIRYRNQSADEFLSVALQLKKELSAIGNNYNQAVKRLHLLSEKRDLQQWLLTHGELHKTMLKKVGEISVSMDKIYQQWLLK